MTKIKSKFQCQNAVLSLKSQFLRKYHPFITKHFKHTKIADHLEFQHRSVIYFKSGFGTTYVFLLNQRVF